MADSITLDQLTAANTKYSTSAGIKLSQLDPKKVVDANNLNYDAISIIQNSAVDELLGASSKTDASETPQTPSYQPLNEALLATMGSYNENSTLSTVTNTTDAFLQKSIDQLNKAGMLDADFYQNAKFGEECYQDTSGVFASIASNMVTAGEKANGKILFASGADFKIAGNQLFLASEGVISEHTPAKVSNSDVAINKSRSHTKIFDTQQTYGKLKTELIQAKNFIGDKISNIAGQTINNFTTNTKTLSTQLNQAQSNIHEVYAGAKAQISSKGEAVFTAIDNLTNMAGNISVIASPGTTSSTNPTKADGVVDQTLGTVQDLANQTAGALNIVAMGFQKGQGRLQVFSQEHLNSTQGDSYQLAAGQIHRLSNSEIHDMASKANYMGAEGASFGSLSGAPLVVSNGMSTMSMSGKLTRFAKTIGSLRTQINPRSYKIPGVNQVPSHPPFPEPLSKESLASCIPDEFKPKSQADSTPDADKQTGTKDSTVKPREQKRENNRYEQKGRAKLAGQVVPTPVASPTGGGTRDYQALRDALRKAKEANGSGEGTKNSPPIATSSMGSVANQEKQPTLPPNACIAGDAGCKGGTDILLDPYNIINPMGEIKDTDEGDDTNIQAQIVVLTPTIIKEAADQNKYNKVTIEAFVSSKSIELLNKVNALDAEAIASLATNSTIDRLKSLLPKLPSSDIEGLKKLLDLPDGPALLQRSIECMNVIAGVGGLFGNVGNAFKSIAGTVTKGVSVASNFSALSGNPLAIYQSLNQIPGVSNITQKITDSVLGKSGFLSDLGKGLLNGNSNITDIIIKAGKDKLKQFAHSQVDKLGTKYGAVATQIYTLLESQSNGQPVDKSTTIKTIAGILSTATGNEEFNKATQLYSSLQPMLNSLSKGDISSILKEDTLSNVVGTVLGDKSVGVISDLKGIYGKGMSLYNTVKAVPTLLNLMNQYRVPTLNQVAVLLGCLDIIDQILGLFNSIRDLFNDNDNQENSNNNTNIDKEVIKEQTVEDVVRFIENLPRLTQVYNTIKEIPEEVIKGNTDLPRGVTPEIDETTGDGGVTNDSGNKPFPGGGYYIPLDKDEDTLTSIPTSSNNNIPPITIDEILNIKELVIEIGADPCYRIPKLNFLEASIEIIEVFEGQISFRLPYYQLLQVNGKNIYPGIGDIIQIRVSAFVREKDNMLMSILEAENYFTPAVYSFSINDFSIESNFGIASIVSNFPYAYLRLDDITYQYSVSDIGKRIRPVIEDAYIIL